MHLRMPSELARRYKSPAQQTRVVSEAWGEENFYCPNCPAERLARSEPNTEAIDFTCPECRHPFQLKSQSHRISNRILDAGYEPMCRAIVSDRRPNLFALHYDRGAWEVLDVLLVPRFVFSLSCIEARRPLAPTAERHDWVGCNIVLAKIPLDARIPVVTNGVVVSPATVRERFARLRPLERLGHEARGWTLDVLNVVRALAREEFTLAEVYARGEELQRLHPQNRYVEAKIRQQLQRLRDLGFVEFVGRGNYRLT
jgi:type II restriction enzyme